ncbi:unnamed protein product [Closterium sp. Naga37s-1]|nr:unnamed protein product [Closterium sp. Naga37s-1]
MYGSCGSVLAIICLINLVSCSSAVSVLAAAKAATKAAAKAAPPPANQPSVLPASCFFALQACDFAFNNSLGFVPLYALSVMQPDVPFTQGILHSKRSAPAISGKLKPKCKAVSVWKFKALKCPPISVIPPSSSSSPSIRFAAKGQVSGNGYSGACFTMSFSQLLVKLGSGPKEFSAGLPPPVPHSPGLPPQTPAAKFRIRTRLPPQPPQNSSSLPPCNPLSADSLPS